jgi:hypothetical protein
MNENLSQSALFSQTLRNKTNELHEKVSICRYVYTSLNFHGFRQQHMEVMHAFFALGRKSTFGI